jgi:hypothetical protein
MKSNFDDKRHQVEKQLLENTVNHAHVCVDRRQSSSVVPSSERELHAREARPLGQGKTVS